MARRGAVVAGHICLDIIPAIPPADLQLSLKPGTLLEVGAPVLSTGGAVSNTGRALHRLGISTRLVGKVGDDPFGSLILDLLRGEDASLADHMIVAPGEVSSYTLVLSPKGMDRSFLHCPGANHSFAAADVRPELLAEAELFHFGYPPLMRSMYLDDGAQLSKLFATAKELGAITSLDMALPDPDGPSGRVDWRAVLARTLPYVDLFLPSLDELAFMLRRDLASARCGSDTLISELAEEVLTLGARAVLVKLGSRGLYLRSGELDLPGAQDDGWRRRELWAPCFRPSPLVGTTGSGDATIAGFLAGIMHGQSVEQALCSAVAVGCCSVEASDSLSGLRSWDDTQARIQSGWPCLPVTVDAAGWTWDEARQLWIGPRAERHRHNPDFPPPQATTTME
jgi:sugar/nucleoside kinase (ribokinase family)